MRKLSKLHKYDGRHGFTIVELLIVIVVIGILAAITIVAYNGVQQRARIAVLQSDMSNAVRVLEIDNVTNGSYPTSAAAANSGAGLRASPGTNYQYTYNSSGNSYCLTGTNNNVAYMVLTANPTPAIGVCPGDTAPGSGGGTSTGGNVTTLAGSGTSGFANGSGTSAQFNQPYGVTVDTAGTIYVADAGNNRIRTITSSGVVSTMAGSWYGFGDGTGTSTQFASPYGIAVDTAGNVYVADRNNQRIRKITGGGVVTTLAGSGTAGFADASGTSAQFNYPSGIAVDTTGNVYVGDSNNGRIRKITANGVVTTLAGSGAYGFANGTGTSAQFNSPAGVAIDTAGNVYVADTGNHRIRKITSGGVVSTLAGSGTPGFADGSGTSAQFYNPYGVAVDASGTVYVADRDNSRIRKIQ
jgi:prepilin-type N-terminal cleavage/methylation domain-containing protein